MKFKKNNKSKISHKVKNNTQTKYSKKLKLRPPIITLKEAFKELKIDKKIGKIRNNAEKYILNAFFLEKNCFEMNMDASYVVFLKGNDYEKKGEFCFELYYFEQDIDENGRSGIKVKERDLTWTKKGFKERHVGTFYYNINEKMGKKETAKIKERKRKEAKKRLVEMVVNTSNIILDRYNRDGRILPLIYRIFPENIKKVYPDSKEALAKIKRTLIKPN